MLSTSVQENANKNHNVTLPAYQDGYNKKTKMIPGSHVGMEKQSYTAGRNVNDETATATLENSWAV